MIGQTLSHFRITAKLGQGGMGEVYRAEDTRLGREVAIKVLPDDFGPDVERRARFEREARVLASLNHPNIAALHQVEEQDGRLFLVMELVEGDDLAQRLAAGPLPKDESIRIAVQVASGLEAAHARGVVHRDLKPANVKVTPDGGVKILDFGLAKAGEAHDEAVQDLSQSPTLTAQMTRAGVILGTAGYMSPEQARGEPADQRADIWSFGVLVYEMLVGDQLFAEPTASDTLAAVLRAEIDWDRLPAGTPENVRRLLRRCLQRDPRRRLHAIADARIELDTPEEPVAPPSEETSGTIQRWRPAVLGALGGIVISSLALLLGVPANRFRAEQPLRLLEVVDGVGVDFFNVQWGLNVSEPRVSPDGSMLVYPSEGRLWVRDMDRLDPRPIEGTEGARDAFWSPDNETLAYVVGSQLRRVGAEGGTSIVLATLDGAYLGGSWGQGDQIVVGIAGRGLIEVPARGGESRLLLPADTEAGDFDFHSPTFLGDGENIAFIRHEQIGYKNTVEVFDGETRREVYRPPGGTVSTGVAFDASARQLIVATIRDNAGLWAVPFEPDSPTAEAELILPNGLAPSVGSDGSLVCVDGLRVMPARIVRVDRAGREIGEVGQALWDMDRPATSPDGSHVAVVATHSGSREVWVHDLGREAALRVTAEPPQNNAIAWTDGGDSVVYTTGDGDRTRIVRQRADGTGGPEVLIEGRVGRASLPRDGRFLVYQAGGRQLRRGSGDLWWFPKGRPEAAEPLVDTPADEVQPAVSPDGKLLAYVSDESQRYEVYLRPLSGDGSRLRVSTRGGEAPFWSLDGGELYYIEGSSLIAIRVETGGQSLGAPEVLFTSSDVDSPLVQSSISSIAVGPGGGFLVVQKRVLGEPRVIAVENWTGLLEK